MNVEIDPDNLRDNQFYSTAYVASMLNITVATVRNWIRDGKLPATRVGRNHRIRRQDLIAFLQSHYKLDTNAETDL